MHLLIIGFISSLLHGLPYYAWITLSYYYYYGYQQKGQASLALGTAMVLCLELHCLYTKHVT